MPSKFAEPRRRRQDHDFVHTAKSTKSTRQAQKSMKDCDQAQDQDASELRGQSSSSGSQIHSAPKATMMVPEMERRASAGSPMESRSSLPYPSFSKAHSREAVDAKPSLLTPDPTDLDVKFEDKRASMYANVGRAPNNGTPPSPPSTVTETSPRRKGNGSIGHNTGKAWIGASAEDIGVTTEQENEISRFTASNTSLRRAEEGFKFSTSPRKSSSPRSKKHRRYPSAPGVDRRSPLTRDQPSEEIREGSQYHQNSTLRSISDSDATSIGTDQPTSRQHSYVIPQYEASPRSNSGLVPRKPVGQGPTQVKSTNFSGLEIFTSTETTSPSMEDTIGLSFAALPPPPPPPVSPTATPRVDYLLQNGGLPYVLPKIFTSASQTLSMQTHRQYSLSQPHQGSNKGIIPNAFAPYLKLLDDFDSVLSKNGSIAVATGYRSIARRLLDRLEAVFARNISSEVCQCVMCHSEEPSLTTQDEDNGVSWGEVLELVSARREMPPWPPFSLASSPTGLNLVDLDQPAPMQKLDIDVPEEYRAHYIRQSKKTKLAVQNWLECQPEDHVSPPQEVDDETLTFAMLTYLEPEQRPIFTALMKGLTTLSNAQAPTPIPANQAATPAPISGTLSPIPKPEFMTRIGLALQRLYRLPKAPRDPECSMFLLRNPSLHSALATLAAISSGEWEILISGRFDGFLWSGAEDPSKSSTMPSTAPVRFASSYRTPTPSRTSNTQGPLSRTTSPAPQRAGASASPSPVQLDEETEIAVLAEVEREIYTGMEALEDAFEALHLKAELVRRALRERGAGLAISAQARRGSAAETPRVRGMTPGQGFGFVGINGGRESNAGELPPRVGTAEAGTVNGSAWAGASGDSETDDGLGGFDACSELAPDDSASNVSGRRRRRRHGASRKSERKTPAPVEEEADE